MISMETWRSYSGDFHKDVFRGMKIFHGVMMISMETWRSYSGDFHRDMFRGIKIFHGVIEDMKKVTSFIQKVEKIKIQF
jgi:hypothetical protein